MHSAPSVSFPVGRSRFHGRLTLLLVLLGGAVCAYWGYAMGPTDGRAVLALGIWSLTSVVALVGWYRTPAGVLRWDGQNWSFESARGVMPGQVLQRLDLQTCVLLEFRAETARAQWLWLEKSVETPRWEALRRALVARGGVPQARAPADPGGVGS